MGGRLLIAGLVLVIVVGFYVGFVISTPEEVKPLNIEPVEPVNEPEVNETVDNETEVVNETANVTENETSNETVIGENVTQPEENETFEPVLILFWSEGCPECATEKIFLREMELKYQELEIRKYEISENETNLELLLEMCNETGVDPSHVPITFIGDRAFIKFRDFSGDLVLYNGGPAYFGYKNQIEDSIRRVLGMDNLEKNPNAWREGLEFSAWTNKQVYSSKEPIRITALIESSMDAGGFYVKAEGLGHLGDFIKESEWVLVKPGNNTAVISDKAPACFGCADFQPGNYYIVVWLEKDQKVINKVTLNIEVIE